MSTFDSILNDLEQNKEMNELTKKTYISRIKKLKKSFKNPSELVKADALLKSLEGSTLNTKLSYLNTVIALKKYTNAFNIDLADYQSKQYDLINQREDKLSEDIQNKQVIDYDKIEEIRERYANVDSGGFEHLITSLYTLIPPLRDDFGHVEFITKNTDDNDINNFYNLKTKTLILNDYKGVNYIRNKKDKKKKIVFPDELHNVIEESLTRFPRDYLITKKKLRSIDEIYVDGNLSGVVKDVFGGITINDIRHSFASKDIKGKGLNLKTLKNDANACLHSLPTHLTYFRGIGG
jgi:hypothetical protein